MADLTLMLALFCSTLVYVWTYDPLICERNIAAKNLMSRLADLEKRLADIALHKKDLALAELCRRGGCKRGIDGEQGESSKQGKKGEVGFDGDRGSPGPKGHACPVPPMKRIPVHLRGDSGALGPTGIKGTKGEQASCGCTAEQVNTNQCRKCTNQPIGYKGFKGLPGYPGRPGDHGYRLKNCGT